VYRTGTRLKTDEFTDTIMLAQGERAILETRFKWPGQYMFHAHVSEFAELGWLGMFEGDAVSDQTLSSTSRPRSFNRILWAILPLVPLAGVMVLFLAGGVGLPLQEGLPPIEEIAVQRVTLPVPNEIVVEVMNSGPDPVAIAQVLVDDAYWASRSIPA